MARNNAAKLDMCRHYNASIKIKIIMKYNIMLVESPLQLLNAYEAINYFNLKNVRYVIRFSGVKSNDLQIERSLYALNINCKIVNRVTINISNRHLLDFVKMSFFMLLSFFAKPFLHRMYVGNYESGFFSLIFKIQNTKKVILLDDGNKSLTIQNQFSDQFSYSCFSMFELKEYKSQEVSRNKFLAIKKKLENDLVIENNCVIFLGCGLGEIGIISNEYYVHLVALISRYYLKQNKYISYIPHRSEHRNKLNEIKKIPNVNIKLCDYPVEMIGLYESKISRVISSFCSTALYSLREIYEIDVECFTFNYTGSVDKIELDSIYDYYDKSGIKIIDLGL